MNRNGWKKYIIWVILCVIAISFFLIWKGGFLSLSQLHFSVSLGSAILDALLAIVVMGIIAIFCGMLAMVDKEDM